MSKYSSYILFLLITIFVVILYLNDFGPLTSLQQSVDDFLCRATSLEGTRPNVALVKIDGPALDEYGAWPWDQDLVADLLAAVAGAKPKAIAVTFEMSEDAAQDSAGNTAVLASQLQWIKNVVLPYDIALAPYRSSKTNNPKYLFNHSITVDNPLGLMHENASLQVRKVFLPADKVLETDPYLAFKYAAPDGDRVLRRQPLVMNYEGYYYPSLSLLAAAVYLGISTSDISVTEGEWINLGSKTRIPINGNGEYYINFGTDNSILSYSAAELLGEGFDFASLKNNVVIIGVDDFSNTDMFTTSVQQQVPDFVIQATVVENFINNNMIEPKNNQKATILLILFIVGGLCAYFLPQVSALYRYISLFCGFIILANVNYFLVSSMGILVNTVFLALELALFMAAAPLLDSALITGETEKALASGQKKKRLPKAKIKKSDLLDFDEVPVREIRESKDLSKDEATTAIDTAADSAEMDKTCATLDPDDSPVKAADKFGDHQTIDLSSSDGPPVSSPEDTSSDEETASKFDFAASSSPEIISPGNDSNGLLSESGHTMTPNSFTNLGRYQILGTLGKGAMGHVYKGVDPAINRPVALKTIRLDFVNDPEEMAELKERLFREAQAAGKLSHPNIVTIYDVGSEGHLQYIAMEYLEGRTLEDMIKKKVKFNYKIIAQMIMQICSALEYAHERGIVHRDIKPANIMVLPNYQVKVMDYGIARVDSNSMTKTGIAMGTPNYISPEQLEGKEVDSRADLFSLGVVVYELLLGKRPFKGENITSLIYAILNKDPEKPSTVNPQIPLLFDRIISKALAKAASDRYQKASEISNDLANFVEAFAGK